VAPALLDFAVATGVGTGIGLNKATDTVTWFFGTAGLQPQKARIVPDQRGAIDKGGASPFLLVGQFEIIEGDGEAIVRFGEVVAHVAARNAEAFVEGVIAAWKYGPLEWHHCLPLQFAHRFKAVGLDPEDYATWVPRAKHRLKPFGVHTGEDSWNDQWYDYLEEHRNATKQEILGQLAKMSKQFGYQCP
jgi:hypothetical protein